MAFSFPNSYTVTHEELGGCIIKFIKLEDKKFIIVITLHIIKGQKCTFLEVLERN